MNKNNKDTKKEGTNATGASNNPTGQITGPNPSTTKLGVFEEDDYFEEFDDEEMTNDKLGNEDIDFKQWQEEWEDEEINDQFEKVLRQEMETFKNSKGKNVA